jgi:hypothetical protein
LSSNPSTAKERERERERERVGLGELSGLVNLGRCWEGEVLFGVRSPSLSSITCYLKVGNQEGRKNQMVVPEMFSF